MGRLVIVSNRVPAFRGDRPKAGGLAVTLAEALKQDCMWFGWSGRLADSPAPPVSVRLGQIELVTADLTPDEYRHFYVGFANSCLWPLFHYRLSQLEFRRDDYRAYVEVNARFAAELNAHLHADDLVWIHDYHLMPLAAMLRRLGARQRLGFFLHIPFPPPAVMDALPPGRELVRQLLACDVVGLQTELDRQHFAESVRDFVAGAVVEGNTIRHEGRLTRVIDMPAGIDPAQAQATAQKSVMGREGARLRESLGGRRLILGVDRLDYSKGISNRFRAYAVLLEKHPGLRRKITYLQIAPRSREDVPEYQALKRELDRLAGSVNGRFGEFDWVPLRYMTRDVARPVLFGFYRQAAIALVTPLRDGMNLVAKEFVAAQDGEDPGVLVLSRFAGVAERFQAALLVNPNDHEEITEAISDGLAMPQDERKERWRDLMAVVRKDNAAAWCAGFLAVLAARSGPPANGSAPRGP